MIMQKWFEFSQKEIHVVRIADLGKSNGVFYVNYFLFW